MIKCFNTIFDGRDFIHINNELAKRNISEDQVINIQMSNSCAECFIFYRDNKTTSINNNGNMTINM